MSPGLARLGSTRPLQRPVYSTADRLSSLAHQLGGQHDVVIDRGHVRKRKKKPSKKFRDAFGHTPLSMEEDMPWKCSRLIIGTGTGRLPVLDAVKHEADRRHIKLVILPTAEAIEALKKHPNEINAILHVTC